METPPETSADMKTAVARMPACDTRRNARQRMRPARPAVDQKTAIADRRPGGCNSAHHRRK
jgi:hypothetical protein